MVRTGASRVDMNSPCDATSATFHQSLPARSVRVNSGSHGQVGRGTASPAMPGGKSFFHQAENGPAILVDQLYPGQRPHLRKIDSAETHSRDEDVDSIPQHFVL